MYNYNQANPYQQNVDIIKSFFKKPFILATTIITFAASALFFFSGISSFIDMVSIMDRKTTLLFGVAEIVLFIFSVVVSVFWFLFYKASRNDSFNSKPIKAVNGLWICSIISLSVVGIISLITTAVCVLSLFDAYTMTEATFTTVGYSGICSSIKQWQKIITFVVVLIMIPLITMVCYTISNFLYIRSIKTSMTSIFLKRTGASAYGVFNIISAIAPFSAFFISLYLLISSEISNYSFITAALSSVSMLCSAVDFILTAVVAIKFSGYINKHINGQVFKHVHKATAPQPAYTPQIQQNYNGVPIDSNNNYAYPQPINSEKQVEEKPFTNYHVNTNTVNRNAYVRIEKKNVQTVDDLSSIPAPEQSTKKTISYNETDSYLF